MGFFTKRSTSRISLETIDALLTSSNVKTRIKGQSLSFRGLIGETRIDLLPSGVRTRDGLEVSETIRIESVFDKFPLAAEKEEIECTFNRFASNGALVVGDDGRLQIKSRISIYSSESEEAIKVYVGVIFFASLIHTNALQAAIIDGWHIPAEKGAPLPDSTVDGVWNPGSFSRTASLLKARGAFVNADGCGLTAEFAWDPGAISAMESLTTGSKKRTSLLRMSCDEHPHLGKGLLCRLNLPLSLHTAEANKLASSLNHMESSAADWPPLLGAWTSNPDSGGPTYVSFWPNMFSKMIGVEMIAGWMGARAVAMPGWLCAEAAVTQ